MNHRDTETQRREEERESRRIEGNNPVADQDNGLTSLVIGSAIEVHRIMGPGLLESVYQLCLERELELRGAVFEPQKPIPLVYKGKQLGDNLILDVYFPGRLVVELKAVEHLLPIHEAQLLTYLRLTGTRLGLLINFNVPVLKNGIKRMIL
jgi:GxxExxY protein